MFAGIREEWRRVIRHKDRYSDRHREVRCERLRSCKKGPSNMRQERIMANAITRNQSALPPVEGVIELDEERKANMVSNLLVVLCGEENARPVVNTGSLYS